MPFFISNSKYMKELQHSAIRIFVWATSDHTVGSWWASWNNSTVVTGVENLQSSLFAKKNVEEDQSFLFFDFSVPSDRREDESFNAVLETIRMFRDDIRGLSFGRLDDGDSDLSVLERKQILQAAVNLTYLDLYPADIALLQELPDTSKLESISITARNFSVQDLHLFSIGIAGVANLRKISVLLYVNDERNPGFCGVLKGIRSNRLKVIDLFILGHLSDDALTQGEDSVRSFCDFFTSRDKSITLDLGLGFVLKHLGREQTIELAKSLKMSPPRKLHCEDADYFSLPGFFVEMAQCMNGPGSEIRCECLCKIPEECVDEQVFKALAQTKVEKLCLNLLGTDMSEKVYPTLLKAFTLNAVTTDLVVRGASPHQSQRIQKICQRNKMIANVQNSILQQVKNEDWSSLDGVAIWPAALNQVFRLDACHHSTPTYLVVHHLSGSLSTSRGSFSRRRPASQG